MKARAGQEAGLVADQLLSPWLRDLFGARSTGISEDLKLPVLAMNGTKDLQVPYGENLRAIRQALEEAGNTSYSIIELPGLNHLFQNAKTGLPDEYSQIESFSETALQNMGDWLSRDFRFIGVRDSKTSRTQNSIYHPRIRLRLAAPPLQAWPSARRMGVDFGILWRTDSWKSV